MLKKKSLVWRDCSEPELGPRIAEWLKDHKLTDTLIFLEGEMGAGKSTFVREILHRVCPKAVSQGSPTFPIVQTYEAESGIPFYHIDLYRLENETELADSGIEAQIDEDEVIACIEWASLFPDSFAHWFSQDARLARKTVYLVSIVQEPSGLRTYTIDSF